MEKRNARKRTQTPHLSCQLCRERKVKCDKVDPCTNCVSAGVVCVPIQRQRLPRGIHVRRSRRVSPVASPSEPVSAMEVQAGAPSGAVAAVDDDLKKRIRHLEELVNSMRSSITSPYPTPVNPPVDNLSHPAPTGSLPCTSSLETGLSQPDPLAGDVAYFWDTIDSERIHASFSPRGAAQARTEAARPPTADTSSMESNTYSGGLRVLDLGGNIDTHDSSPLSQEKETTRQLCQVYLQQVDPVIKILHRPSVEKWMMQGEQYLGFPDGHVAVDALGSAVRFAAAASLTENQCWARFHMSKSTLVADTRRVCETALDRGGLLACPSITALQAFVLYLIARRCEDSGWAAWTLTAVAVRLAKALHLHRDGDETFFNQQMRRRLWLTICLMDLKASFSHASDPLISPEEATSTFLLPRHINDSDFDPTTDHEVPDEEGLTDTTFALVTYHIQLAGRVLNFGAATSGGDKARLQQHAHQFEQDALRLLHFCDPESSPYAWFTWHGTQCLVSGARLSALRPLKRPQLCSDSSQLSLSASPRPQEHNTESLRLTVNVLEKAQLMHADPRGEAFRWYVTIPWHAVATAVTECLVCGDESLIRRAWPIIEASYQLLQQKSVVSVQGDAETIQRPLQKLMRRAREQLAPLLQRQVSSSPSLGCSSSTVTSATRTPSSRSRPTSPIDDLSTLSWPTLFSHHHSGFGSDLASAACGQPSTKLDLDPSLLMPFDMDTLPLTDQIPPVDLEQRHQAWEGLMSDISQDESTGSSMFFC
ncbi:hypothetical protein BJY01DRAFT_186605 [Aspergillus pseudoustus]|uniref:Zn(2)-C6 fungal-type domain-containing protein n=1 Tax=Aspergillus pseudoustus TaxID=1810923 RepID=A0ABR4KXG7_9EURO